MGFEIWPALNQSVSELLSLGAIDPAPLFLGFYLAKLPFLRVNEIEPSNAFLLRTYNSLWSDLGLSLTNQGRVCPETVSLTMEGYWVELKSLDLKLLTILSDLDWWIADISSPGKVCLD